MNKNPFPQLLTTEEHENLMEMIRSSDIGNIKLAWGIIFGLKATPKQKNDIVMWYIEHIGNNTYDFVNIIQAYSESYNEWIKDL